ncbi:unnamed protein product [Brassicogethes aeneus]|uniref:Lysosome-associated membrane glycoprotein 5 n=1 Tax=Brassicogethes aeneus TaxID=1431903 RepID=A0A9P0B9J0_BRAAE|nr:unnamed protein product [Brassicogethes aeneus]
MGNTSWKINLPTTANASGDCSQNNTEVLELKWGNANMIKISFDKTNTSKFEVQNMSFALNLTFPGKNASIYNYNHSKCEFTAPLENSYKCDRVQTLNFTGVTDPTSMAYLHISHVQLQAFHNTTGTHFNSAIDCEGSSSADVVPIVVGCVLAGLVLMVLVGYLVGRRHCQARGYLSM